MKRKPLTRDQIDAGIDDWIATYTAMDDVVRDQDGDPIVNAKGEELHVRRWIVPPTQYGLAHHLGMTGASLFRLLDADAHPDMAGVKERVESILREYLWREELTRKGSDTRGVEFDLTTNHGATSGRVEVSGFDAFIRRQEETGEGQKF